MKRSWPNIRHCHGFTLEEMDTTTTTTKYAKIVDVPGEIRTRCFQNARSVIASANSSAFQSC
jgi:hypothetical protein